MEVHARAPLSPIGRQRVVDRVVCERWSVTAAAEAAAVSERTVYRWLARWRIDGSAGLVDRRSVPGRIPRKTPADRVAAICALRQLRLTAAEIAECLDMPLSTISAVLLREGLGKRSRLAPVEPPNRYERRAAGELIHIDIKKLGRIVVPGHALTGNRRQRARRTGARRIGTAGWEFVHVAVDDFSRLAYAEVLDDETTATAVGFLRRALGYFADHGITNVKRVMTDNGAAYRATSIGSPATSSGSSTSSPAPTGRAPTARRRDSSRLSPSAGPTAASTPTAPSAPQRSTPGSTTTTSSDPTAASATSHPAHD